jgi:glycosyltransferase involved in cell wall biosynthesis
VYTPHAWYTQNPDLGAVTRGTYRVIERALASVTDRIISVSSDEAEHAVAIGIRRRKLVVIENGIESWTLDRIAAVRAQARARLGIAPNDIVVGFLGRLAAQKAPDLALRVYRRILDECPDVRLVLAGEGPEAARVDALIGELGLAGRVIKLPVAHGPDLIPAFDVLLMTSRYEGFPYVLLEALAAGCAIVTTRVGGVRDCVLDGVNGSVVDEFCPDAIARRVLDIATDTGLLARMCSEARAHASNFSIDRMLDRTADLYRSLHEAS